MKPPTGIRNLSGTGARFALLMVLVTASSVPVLDQLLEALWNRNDTTVPLHGLMGCVLAAGIDPANGDHANFLAVFAGGDTLRECVDDRSSRPYRGTIATLVVLVVAGLVYWLLPKARDRRRRTVPVEAVDPDGTLRAELDALRERTGIRAHLDFRVDPTRTTSGAGVYGRTGRYTVCLHAGLLARHGTDTEGFRAVVLHELAHVHHHDVDYAYAATALWRAYVVLVLIPQFAFFGWLSIRLLTGPPSPWSGIGPTYVGNVTTGALLAGLVHLARADLLRHRELHADLRAVAWGAHAANWNRPDPAGPTTPLARRLTAPLRTHPDWAQRRRVLADPARLFRAAPLEMFLTGVAAELLSSSLALVEGSPAQWITIALVTPVMCLALGLPIIRSPHAAGKGIGSGVRAGLWLGCGMLVAELVTSMRFRVEWLFPQPQYLPALLIVAVVPAVWWSQTLPLALSLPKRRSRWSAATLCAMVTAAVLWAGLTWWQSGGLPMALGVDEHEGLADLYAAYIPGPWQDYDTDLTVFSHALIVLAPLTGDGVLEAAMLLMWLLPLILLQRPGTRPRLRPTLVAGLAGALVAWAGLAAVMIRLNTRRPATQSDREGAFVIVHVWWMVVTVLAACLLTAALVAALSRGHWLLKALIAAQMVQLLAYPAVFLLGSADGCLGPLNMEFDTCRWQPEKGAAIGRSVAACTLVNAVFGAACGALVGAGIAGAARRLRGTSTPEESAVAQRVTPRTRWLEVSAVGTVLVLTVPTVLLIVDTKSLPTSPPAIRPAHNATGTDPSGTTPTRPWPGPTPPRTEDPRLRAWKFWSWWDAGGLRHAQEITAAVQALTVEVNKTGDGPQDPGGLAPFDPDAYARACGLLRTRVEEAQEYFPVPGPDLQESWWNVLNRIRGGALACQDALAQARELASVGDAQGERFLYGIEEIAQGMQSFPTVLQDILNAATYTPE